jgi:hypothetical protein
LLLAVLAVLVGVFCAPAVNHFVAGHKEATATRRASSLLAVLDVSTHTSSFSPAQGVPAVGLTVADFTGDTHLDLATVDLDRIDSANAHYSIDIHLSEGRSQVLALTAPYGGIAVVAKDMTGDGNLDLVVRAARTRDFVAVYLNDGNGHFDRANRDLFSGLIGDQACSSLSAREMICPTSILGCPESQGIDCPTGYPRPVLEENYSRLSSGRGGTPTRFFRSQSNRAPPTLA